MIKYEWRVQWRRAAWKPATGDRFRLFARRHDAENFIAKRLLGDDRPHLSPIIITCTRRPVGAWQAARLGHITSRTAPAVHADLAPPVLVTPRRPQSTSERSTRP